MKHAGQRDKPWRILEQLLTWRDLGVMGRLLHCVGLSPTTSSGERERLLIPRVETECCETRLSARTQTQAAVPHQNMSKEMAVEIITMLNLQTVRGVARLLVGLRAKSRQRKTNPLILRYKEMEEWCSLVGSSTLKLATVTPANTLWRCAPLVRP